MSIKFKAFGLSLLAVMAMGTVGVVSTTASTGGHFVVESSHTEIKGEDLVFSPTKFTAFGNSVGCVDATYTATTSSMTATEITVTPTYHNCSVPGIGLAVINMHGCDYVLTAKSLPELGDNTVHLVCPSSGGPTITIVGPFGNCRLEITANQTPAGGVGYKTEGSSGATHSITATATLSGIHTVVKEGGFFQCGTASTTTSTATLTGEVAIRGFATAGFQVGITVT